MPGDQDSRFSIIDMYLHYWGRLRRQDLQNHWAVGSVTASRILKTYNVSYPANMLYSVSHRAYIWSESFRAEQLPPAEVALDVLANGRASQPVSTRRYGPEEALFRSPLAPKLVGAVTRAMVGTRAVNVSYVSGTSGASNKTLFPHAILESGGAWYFRAFDWDKQDFRTFRFNRIVSLLNEHLPSDCGTMADASMDLEWHTPVVLTLAPHSRHPRPQALQLDLGLQNRPVKNIISNSVTAPFLLTDLRVDCSESASLDPFEYPLQLMNRSEVKQIQGMVLAPGFQS